ncbi:MAG: hypothetical protein Rubg2KO_22960 [Rubricoccaceae bacterium]
MAVTSRTASRVLLASAILTALIAVGVATYGAIRGGPFVPVLVIVGVQLAMTGLALGLRAQLLRQHPIEEPPPARSEDTA